MFRTKGIELLDESGGTGATAEKGSRVIYNARFFLRRGDEVTFDAKTIARCGDQLATRIVEGVELIDHETEIGRRRVIAGVEKSLLGMRAGGYREVMVSSHLAYGARGLAGSIPPGSMLRIRLWLREVLPPA
jgi:FKBP-type peptidyl-prolyl cis-trans isomerase (trigger factor)